MAGCVTSVGGCGNGCNDPGVVQSRRPWPDIFPSCLRTPASVVTRPCPHSSGIAAWLPVAWAHIVPWSMRSGQTIALMPAGEDCSIGFTVVTWTTFRSAHDHPLMSGFRRSTFGCDRSCSPSRKLSLLQAAGLSARLRQKNSVPMFLGTCVFFLEARTSFSLSLAAPFLNGLLGSHVLIESSMTAATVPNRTIGRNAASIGGRPTSRDT